MSDTKYTPVSETIRNNMKQSGKRFWAGDNISDQLTDSLKEQLIDEATVAFESVLDALLIDRKMIQTVKAQHADLPRCTLMRSWQVGMNPIQMLQHFQMIARTVMRACW